MGTEPRAGARPGILLTRTEEDCERWAEELAALGLRPLIFPCIECHDLDTPALRARLAHELARADWLAFTSRRGVAAFARLCGDGMPDALPRVAVVGSATAEAARDLLGRVDLMAPSQTAASLGDALAERLASGERVLAAVAENAGDDLERALSAASVVRLNVYRTQPAPPRDPPEPMSSLGAAAIFFASPSAVAGFVNRVSFDMSPDIFTIGPSTTAAARAAGLTVTGEASRPGLAGLLEAMQCAK